MYLVECVTLVRALLLEEDPLLVVGRSKSQAYMSVRSWQRNAARNAFWDPRSPSPFAPVAHAASIHAAFIPRLPVPDSGNILPWQRKRKRWFVVFHVVFHVVFESYKDIMYILYILSFINKRHIPVSSGIRTEASACRTGCTFHSLAGFVHNHICWAVRHTIGTSAEDWLLSQRASSHIRQT